MGRITKTLQKGIDGFYSIFAKRQTNDPRWPEHRTIPYNGRTQAGVYVTPDRALMNDTVWACHRYISETCGQLPAEVKQKTSNGNKTVDYHPVDTVLNWRPNPELSPFQFRETMVGWALTHGNGIAEIERDSVGRVKYLWPILPKRIRILRSLDDLKLIYRVYNNVETVGPAGGYVDLAPEDVFHLRGFGNGPVGLSVVEYAAQTIGYARAVELFGASYFGEGMHFGGAVVLPGKADQDTQNRVREELELVYRGPTRSGKWFVGDGDMKITKMTATPNESQFLETQQYLVEAVCRWFGVPPHKVGHLLRMTFNNVEQLSIDAVGQCIVPWALRLEQEATFKLFGQNRSNLFVMFDIKGLLRGDFVSRQTGLQVQRRNGIINGNDWADEESIKRPKVGGEVYIVETNMTSMDNIMNPPKQIVSPQQNPITDPANPNKDPTLDPLPIDPSVEPDPGEEALRYLNESNLLLETFDNINVNV